MRVKRAVAVFAMVVAAWSAPASPAALAQTEVGRAYVTSWGSDKVSVVDLATNSVVATIPVGDQPMGVAVTPDASRVYVSNERSNSVSVIDTATNAVVGTMPVGESPKGIRANPSGTEVWVANAFAGGVSVIDTATNTVIATVAVSPFAHDVAFLPDGSRAYVSTQVGDVSVVDTATRTVIATIDVGDSLWGIEILPDGSKIYVAHLIATDVAVIDPATNTVVKSIPVGAHPQGLAVSPNGSRIYVGDLATGLWVIDTATDTATRAEALSGAIDVGVSPAGDRIYVSQSSGVAVVDAATLAAVDNVALGADTEAIAIAALRRPVIGGSTWFSSGAKARSGPAGSTVALYGVGATAGVPYRLVLSRTSACADLVAFLNPTTVSAGPNGVIGTVRGTVPAGTPAGTYWLCFRHTAGATATGVVTFTVS